MYVEIFVNPLKLEMKLIENSKNIQARKTVKVMQIPYNIIEYNNIIAQRIGQIIKLYICTYPCTYSSIFTFHGLSNLPSCIS